MEMKKTKTIKEAVNTQQDVVAVGYSDGKVVGRQIAFGVGEPCALVGFPEGRTRVRMRNSEFVRVYVLTQHGIREFVPAVKNGEWHCEYDLEQGRNIH